MGNLGLTILDFLGAVVILNDTLTPISALADERERT